MKPDRSKFTTKALTVFLALALMTGAFTACSNTGSGRNGGSGSGRVEAECDLKPEYGNEGDKPEEEPAPDGTDDVTDGGAGGSAGGAAGDNGGSAGDNGGSADGNGGTTDGATGGSTSGGLLPDGYVFDEECWHVQEFTDFGITYTQIMNGGSKPRQGEIDFLTFKIYANDEDSMAAYEHYYDQSKDFDKGHWEEGANWFISDEWGVMDASMVWMVYRDGNMLIIAHLAINDKWIVYGDKDPDAPEPTESTYKAYVLNNADGIVSFVKEHFLESK